MTEQSFDEKFQEMADKVPAMLQEFKRAALRSGGVDLPSAGDDYALPRIVLAAALEDLVFQWRPYSSEARATVKNLVLVCYPDYVERAGV